MHLILLGERLASCARVLEFGCGAEATATKFFANRGCETFATDTCELTIQRAKSLAPRATFLVADTNDLDFPDDYFDLIFCQNAIAPMTHDARLSTLRSLGCMMRPAALLVVGMSQNTPSLLDEITPVARAVGLSLIQVADAHFWFAKT